MCAGEPRAGRVLMGWAREGREGRDTLARDDHQRNTSQDTHSHAPVHLLILILPTLPLPLPPAIKRETRETQRETEGEERESTSKQNAMSLSAAASAVRAAVLRHMRLGVQGFQQQQMAAGASLAFARGFAGGHYLDKSEVTERVLNVTKHFEKIQADKVRTCGRWRRRWWPPRCVTCVTCVERETGVLEQEGEDDKQSGRGRGTRDAVVAAARVPPRRSG
jgi:hypothetical protein